MTGGRGDSRSCPGYGNEKGGGEENYEDGNNADNNYHDDMNILKIKMTIMKDHKKKFVFP